MLKSVGRRENLEKYETYLALPQPAVKKKKKLTAKHFILNDELGRGGGGGGEGGSPKKFSMQFIDSNSQQQSPLVAFLATSLLVIPSSRTSDCNFCYSVRVRNLGVFQFKLLKSARSS